MRYSCTRMATVGVKGLTNILSRFRMGSYTELYTEHGILIEIQCVCHPSVCLSVCRTLVLRHNG